MVSASPPSSDTVTELGHGFTKEGCTRGFYMDTVHIFLAQVMHTTRAVQIVAFSRHALQMVFVLFRNKQGVIEMHKGIGSATMRKL